MFLKLSLNVLQQALFRKKKTKMIGHENLLKRYDGPIFPIYACSRANHAHYSLARVKFCSS